MAVARIPGPPSYHSRAKDHLRGREPLSPFILAANESLPPSVCLASSIVSLPPGSLIRGARVAVLQLEMGNQGTEGAHGRLAYR